MRLAADYPQYSALYHEMLVTLEPMVHLPFDLSIDFESRQASMESVRGVESVRNVEGPASDVVSDTSSTSEQLVSLKFF